MPPSTTVVSSMTPTRAARGTRRVPVSASGSLTVAASLGWARRMHSVGQTMVPAGERPPNGLHSGAHVRLLHLIASVWSPFPLPGDAQRKRAERGARHPRLSGVHKGQGSAAEEGEAQ